MRPPRSKSCAAATSSRFQLPDANPAGNGAGRPSTQNPFTKQFWNKTQQGQLLVADRVKAERLAKAAGFKSLDEASRAAGPVA